MRIALALLIVVAGCEPDYANTAFRCDTDRGGTNGCPDDQTCVSGRCRRGGVTAEVTCGAGGTCNVEQQCCHDDDNGDRCIPAGDLCPGKAALCDGKADCANGDGCCNGKMTACGPMCDSHACAVDADCPTEEPNCCPTFLGDVPWGECSLSPC